MNGNDSADGQSGIRAAVEKMPTEELEREIARFEKEGDEEREKRGLPSEKEIMERYAAYDVVERLDCISNMTESELARIIAIYEEKLRREREGIRDNPEQE